MYKNLMAELAKREMSLEELSKEMGIKQEMLLLKMENRHGINFKEAVKSERTPAYRGGSFLLQREQHH